MGKEGIWEKSLGNKEKRKLKFTVILNQGNKEREKVAIVLQQQYRKLGVKMKIRVMEWSAMLKIISTPKDPKDFDKALGSRKGMFIHFPKFLF